MSELEETEKKRKAEGSPLNDDDKMKIIRKAKRTAQQFKKLELSTSEEEDDRIRTPSGTEFNKKVADIRNYFSSNTQQEVSGSNLQLNSQEEESAVAVKAQAVNRGDPIESHGHGSVNSTVHRRGRQGRRRARSLSVKRGHQNKNNDQSENDHTSTAASEADGESAFTQDASFTTDPEDNEDKFLYALASILPTATDEQVDEMIKRGRKKASPNKSADNEQSSYHSEQDETSENKTTGFEQAVQNLEEKMETNDDNNPKTMAVTSVLEMFRELKRDIAQENRQLRVDLKKDLQALKQDCVQTARKEIKEMAVHEGLKRQQVEADLSLWKLKSETLTEVCDRMSKEIADLTTRMENLEMNNSKRMVIHNWVGYVDHKKEK